MSDPQPYIEPNSESRKWKITRIEKIRGERNGGRHNAFVFIADINGNRLSAANLPKVKWTWAGRQDDQIAKEPSPKSPPDPYDYDIPLERGVYASIWIRGQPSDKAHAVTAMLPDEDEWNTWGHHSWEIWFQWVEETQQPPPPPPPPTEGQRLIAEIQQRLIRLLEIVG